MKLFKKPNIPKDVNAASNRFGAHLNSLFFVLFLGKSFLEWMLLLIFE